MNNKYPIHIPSKGRHDSNITVKSLQRMKVENYYVIVEEQEYDLYKKALGREHLLVLDKKFQDEYKTLDDLGTSKSKGPGAARNFAWSHSISLGSSWHWVMDDNIFRFSRFTNNNYYEVRDPVFFRIMEDFCERYENVAMAGPNYEMFVTRKEKHPPFILNTRIYSCNLIKNSAPFRWRGRYNEDTILSLDMLTAGLCTVQFNAFLQFKATTQTVKGGCNAISIQRKEHYQSHKCWSRRIRHLPGYHGNSDVPTIMWTTNHSERTFFVGEKTSIGTTFQMSMTTE